MNRINGLTIDLTTGYLGLGYSDLSIYHLEGMGDKKLPITNLIATQEKAYRETIDNYKRMILKDELPTYVLVIQCNDKYYIGDGHHRAIAYAELGMLVECEIFSVDKTYGDLQGVTF